MAARGWGASIATAIGIAAIVGAAQVGLGYGLEIIAWQPSAGETGDSTWVASLAWTTWIAATSVVIGAICADRLSVPRASMGASGATPGNPARVASGLWRLALALAAAVGALAMVPLVAVRARSAVRADTFTPQTTAATYAVAGVLVGLIIAVGALAARAIAANAVATATWLWLLAVVAVIDGAAAGRGLVAAQLGVWQFSADGPWFRNVYLPGAVLTLAVAFFIGMLAPLPAARRGDNPVGVAISGAMGPLLVSAAYFLAAPAVLERVSPRDISAYWIAPYAVVAGLAGSVVIAALTPRLQQGLGPKPAIEGPPAEDTRGGLYGSDQTDSGGKSPLWPEEAATAAGQAKPGRKER
jgi:hypothetical protein